MNVYEKLIEDYNEIQEKNLGFSFGRIMNFIFNRLDDKYLYLVIRSKVSLLRLRKMMSDDWCNSSYARSDQLIRLAKKWRKN